MLKNLRGSLFLLAASIIWGFAFTAQSTGMETIGPLTFQAVRMSLAAFFLVPLALIAGTVKKRRAPDNYIRPNGKKLFLSGAFCGVLLFFAAISQQIGIKYTSVGHSGFITALYLLIVPVLSLVIFRKKVAVRIWFCIAAALVGMYFLCLSGEDAGVSAGDLLVLVCAFLFAAHIITVDRVAALYDGVAISAIQMSVAAALSLIAMFIFEEPAIGDILVSWEELVYTGILSCGVAYTFQIIGQKHCAPTPAAIIMSFESVFAVLGGALFLNERLTDGEIVGCVLMFASIIVSQIDIKRKKSAQ